MAGDIALRAGDPAISYRIRRSARARRVRVSVDAALGVEVVLPPGATQRAAASAVRELRPWIERRLRDLESARAAVAARAGTVPYLDERLTLVPEAGRTRVHRRDDELLVPRGEDRLAALERWYRRAARHEVADRLDAACTASGL